MTRTATSSTARPSLLTTGEPSSADGTRSSPGRLRPPLRRAGVPASHHGPGGGVPVGARRPGRARASATSTGPGGSRSAPIRTTSPATTRPSRPVSRGGAARAAPSRAQPPAQVLVVRSRPALTRRRRRAGRQRPDEIRARASSAEVLRHRDLAELTRGRARATLRKLLGPCSGRDRRRPSRRLRPARHGAPDPGRTLRRDAAPGRRAAARPADRGPARAAIVLLVDVSGSMAALRRRAAALRARRTRRLARAPPRSSPSAPG